MFEKTKENKSREKLVFRSISDEIYITFCVYDMLFFFFQDYFSVNLYRKLFFDCKKKYIIVILSFLIEKIIFYFRYINKVQKNTFFLVKFLEYPFLIHKIYFLLISRCCSWSVLTNFLEWLVGLIFYQIQLEKRVNFVFKFGFEKSIWQKTFITCNLNLNVLGYCKWKKILWSQLIISIYTKKIFKNEQINKHSVLECKGFFYKYIFVLYKKIESNYFEKKSLFGKIFLFKFFELNIYLTRLKLNLNQWLLVLCDIKNLYYKHIATKINSRFYEKNILIHIDTEIYLGIYFYFLSFIFYCFQLCKLNFKSFFLLKINILKFNLIKLKSIILDFSICLSKKFSIFSTNKYFSNLVLFARSFLIHQILKAVFMKKKHQIFIKNRLKNENETVSFILYKKIFSNNNKFHSENILPIFKLMKKVYVYVNIKGYSHFNKGNVKICDTT
nr:hypothetical protein CparaKRNrm1_p062 [Cryptomonas paramecium]